MASWHLDILDLLRLLTESEQLSIGWSSTYFSHIHPVFHISILRKYIPNPSHALQLGTVELNEDLTFEEQLVAIVDYQVR